MTRSSWLVCVGGLAVAACAAPVQTESDTAGLGGGLPTTAVTLPFSGKFQLASGDMAGVAIQLPRARWSVPVFAHVRRTATTGPSIVLWASTQKAGDLAERTGASPYLTLHADRDLVIGMDNKSASQVDGTLSIAYTPEEAYCGGKTTATARLASDCDGTILRVCGADPAHRDGRGVRYLEIDCSSRGGCYAAAGRCLHDVLPVDYRGDGRSAMSPRAPVSPAPTLRAIRSSS